MADYYDLYGCASGCINDIVEEVQSSLGIKFHAHESDELGMYYRYTSISEETLQIQNNLDCYAIAEEDAWFEPKYKNFLILLYIDKTQRPEQIGSFLMSCKTPFKLLRREVFDACREKDTKKTIYDYAINDGKQE